MDVKKSRKLATAIVIVTIFLAITAAAIAWYYYSISDVGPGQSNANLDETVCKNIDLYDSSDTLTPLPAFRGDILLNTDNSYDLVVEVSEAQTILAEQDSKSKVNFFTLLINGQKQEVALDDSTIVDIVSPGEYVLTFSDVELPENVNQVNFIVVGHNETNKTDNPLFACDTLTFTIDTGDNSTGTTTGSDTTTTGSTTGTTTTGVVEPVDYYSCSIDADCVKVTNTCCGCENGGTEIAVNSNYQTTASRGLNCTGDEICTQVYQCTNKEAYCNSGSCSLRDAVVEPGDDQTTTGGTTTTTTGTSTTTTGTTTTGVAVPGTVAVNVSKTGTMCVERVAPNNKSTFTVNINNTGTASNNILKIVDKLPLGFTYVAGSAKLNGVVLADTTFLEIITTGNTQELTWENTSGWTIASQGSLILTFEALAGANALTGQTMNEVVVTPSSTPTDLTTLRTSFTFNVAQNCTSPETGVLDSAASKIFIGILIIVGAFTFYRSKRSMELSENIASMEVGDNVKSSVKLGVLKATEPRKYFEEKIKRKIEK